MIHKLFPAGAGCSPAQRWAQRSAWLVFGLSVVTTLVSWRYSVAEFDEKHVVASSLLLIAGLLISILLAGLVWALVHTRQLAAQIAQEMSESLRQSEERWSLALDGLGGGVTDWNIETGEALYSRRWKEMLGYAEDEIGTQVDEWLKRVHVDDMPRLTANMEALFDDEISSAALEFRMQCKDGSWKWLHGHGVVVSRDAAGKPLRLIGTNLDITDRKRAEITRDALLDAHEDAEVGLVAVSHGRVAFANPAMAAITGYSLEELKALPDMVAALVHPDDYGRMQRRYDQRLAGEYISPRYETTILTKSGERREVELAATSTPDSDEFQMLGIMIDITERKQLSAKLQESHDLLATISRQVPGVIFQLRLYPDGRYVYPFISESVEELYGVSSAAIRADASVLFSFLHPDDAEGLVAVFYESAQTLERWRHEYRVVLPKLGVRWMLAEARPERLEDGSVVWHGFSTDITTVKDMQEALSVSEERFRSLTQLGADWYWEQDENFRFTEITGGQVYQQIQSVSQNALGKTRWEIIAESQHASDLDAHLAQLARHEPFRNFEFSRNDDEGKLHFLSISGEPVFDKDGRFAGYRGVGSDITQRKLAEEELRLASLVYENSSEAMSVTSANGIVITINPAFTAVTGYAAEEVIGHHSQLFSVEQPTYDIIKQAIDTIGHWQGEVWNQRKNGEMYPAALTLNTIFSDKGLPYRYVALFSDITNRKQTEELIWRQANFDALTQLPNRSMFHERVDQEIKKAHRSGAQLALLFIDLDHFKEVNDTLGHDTGDDLLVEAARRISACVRETDAVARLGGDEFTVLLSGIDDGENGTVDRIAQGILDHLAQPFRLGEEEVYVSASLGITMYPGDAVDIEVLFRNADQAMYLSKSHGRNRCSYFTPELQDAAQARLRMINDLRGALAGDQFLVYFQPIVELATGRIVKAEALLRWRHPQRGMVLPGEFIALAEETGLIHEVGEWVFKEAVRWVGHWRARYDSSFQVSVNKSPVQFHRDAAGHVAWLAYLQGLGLPGQSIAIEITEGVLLNADPSIAQSLLGCRDAGIQVAIDDFGTGYSSLAYLNKFDIDYLKIDQSFIRNLSFGTSEMALSEAIIVMAHKLGLKVIAEGVETEEQRDLLASINCDYMQGYLFAKPLPPDEFELLLSSDVRMI